MIQLRFGDIVYLRNGEKTIFIDNKLINKNGGYCLIDYYEEYHHLDIEYDIVKIQTIENNKIITIYKEVKYE